MDSTEIELPGRHRRRVRPRVAGGTERDALWHRLVELYKGPERTHRHHPFTELAAGGEPAHVLLKRHLPPPCLMVVQTVEQHVQDRRPEARFDLGAVAGEDVQVERQDVVGDAVDYATVSLSMNLSLIHI